MPHSIDPRFADFLAEYGVGSLEELGHFPKFIQLETVSGCNARCKMCSVDSWTRSSSSMSDGLFTRLVQEIAAHADWVEQVTLQLGGEPLLDRRLEQRVRQLKEAEVRCVSFTTNASLLTEARARAVLESGIDAIDFSIDGASEATFEAIRDRLSYTQVHDNVLEFLELREQLGKKTAVRVRMVIQKENAHEFDSFVDYWQSRLRPGDAVIGRLLNWWSTWQQDLGQAAGTRLRQRSALPDINVLPCLAPFSTLIVLSDGRVPLCCLDYNADEPMGNVRNASIADVWRDAAFQAVRSRHLAAGRNAMDFCRECHIFASGSGFDYPGTAS